mgnify:CR=1 FL=1
MISPRHNLLRCSSVVILVVSFGVGISGCAQGPDDLIDDLSGTVEEREAATQELLLAKERAVEPPCYRPLPIHCVPRRGRPSWRFSSV